MKTTVSAGRNEGKYLIIMNETIDDLRKALWRTIFEFRKKNEISDCDVTMALGMVQYELIHHTEG
jgi:hypothetical protein